MQGMGKLDLARRVKRLGELSQGLAAEVQRWRAGADPLAPTERRRYLHAIQDTLAAAEEARVALARALDRLERERALREKRCRQRPPNAPA
jgi:hypothetical protein